MTRLAVVVCAHHKPWLGMATLISLVAQKDAKFDLHVCYNVGDGNPPQRATYQEYYRLSGDGESNVQLSPFDERVREVFRLREIRVVEHEFQNDHALDSGCWYKFLRTNAWREYEYVLFFGEGSIFTRPSSLAAMIDFARRKDAHFIASGHEKRRLPRRLLVDRHERLDKPTRLGRLHADMVASTFNVFRRDPSFAKVLETWDSSSDGETQDHVPDIWPRSPLASRLWHRANLPGDDRTAAALRAAMYGLQTLRARLAVAGLMKLGRQGEPRIHVNSTLIPVSAVPGIEMEGFVRFHREAGPEWFGCATNHLLSRSFLERLVKKLDDYSIWEVLDYPFVGYPLEILWGFMPAWLGYEKWFTDAIHRPRKNFVTYRREDNPAGMSYYLNRYLLGDLCVVPRRDHLLIRALSPRMRGIRKMLPAVYFKSPT